MPSRPGPPISGWSASRKRGDGSARLPGRPRRRRANSWTGCESRSGLDLGKTSHTEIAVAILAELVQLRAAGELGGAPERPAEPSEAVDPVCGMTVPARPAGLVTEHEGVTYYFCCAGCRSQFESRPRLPTPGTGGAMLINNDFEVAQPVETVWQFFGDIPRVASCLPGAELTETLGDDKYGGRVAVRMGPVRLQFAGTAEITERDEAAKRIVVHATGAEERGRGQASMVVSATLAPASRSEAAPRWLSARTCSCRVPLPSTAGA